MMSSTGYSGTPLIKKLAIKQGMKILLINQPGNYFELLRENILDDLVKETEVPALVHLFVKSIKEFEKEMKKIKGNCKKNSKIIIWVSWYKKASKIPTDMTEDVIRNYALANGLVDIKVCAIDEKWSALKLVVPLAKR